MSSCLQLYLFLGVKLTKIHRVLQFEQPDWMKGYVDFNTEKRKMQPMISRKNFLN